jgi:hypothetical protein
MSRGKPTHVVRFDTKLPQHEGSPHVYYVIDCVCGWQSPLCNSQERASELYEAHRVAVRTRKKARKAA